MQATCLSSTTLKKRKKFKCSLAETHSHTPSLIHSRLKQSFDEGRVIAHKFKSFPSKRDARKDKTNKGESVDAREDEALTE